MESPLEAYQKMIKELDFHFRIILFKLGVKPRWPIALMGYHIVQVLILVYLFLFQPSDFFVFVQQVWAAIAVAQIPCRGINFIVHWDEMEELLGWYESIYSTRMRKEYQALLDKHLVVQNREIYMVLRLLKGLLTFGAFFYVFMPIIMKTGMCPTPVVWNGIPADQLPLDIYLFFYICFAYNCFNIFHSSFTNEGFFAISMSCLGHRFALIGDILKLLNYEGKRNRAEDQRILKDAYLMHLEALEKMDLFETYFTMYGLSHLASPLFINSMLLYNLLEHGFDMMSAGVALAMFNQIVIVSVLAEMLQKYADELCNSIDELNWENLHVQEQHFVKMIMIRTQQPVNVVAGKFFVLNYALITQVVKLQASICAFLQNI